MEGVYDSKYKLTHPKVIYINEAKKNIPYINIICFPIGYIPNLFLSTKQTRIILSINGLDWYQILSPKQMFRFTFQLPQYMQPCQYH